MGDFTSCVIYHVFSGINSFIMITMYMLAKKLLVMKIKSICFFLILLF